MKLVWERAPLTSEQENKIRVVAGKKKNDWEGGGRPIKGGGRAVGGDLVDFFIGEGEPGAI